MEKILIFSLLISAIDATVKTVDGKVQSLGYHAIKNTCKKELIGRIDIPCVWFIRQSDDPENRDHLSMSDEPYTWELVIAEEGGYHIRHCQNNACLYWTDTENDGWDYVKLASVPKTRFTLEKVGKIRHKEWKTKFVSGGITVNLIPEAGKMLIAMGYRIIMQTSKRYKYITYNKNWLIKDKDDWNWFFDPPLLPTSD